MNNLAKALRLICALLGASVALAFAHASWVLAADGASRAGSSELSRSAPASSRTIDDIVGLKSNEDQFLQPDEAFQFAATPAGPDTVRLTWQIADGYYLYRARIKVQTTSDRAQIGALALPQGVSKKDDYFGVQEIYHNQIIAALPVARSAGGAFDLPLKVTYQGCAEKGICYTPITKTLNVTLPASGSASGLGPTPAASTGSGSTGALYVSEQDRFADIIKNASLWWVILASLASGVLLSFTPCVLPMIPIVTGLIIGDGTKAVTTRRSFLLALAYVLGMASAYTVAGLIVGASGKQFQAALQKPWVIGPFSAVFVLLALAMFGLFTLQMPAAIQTRVASISNRQSAGTFGGAAIMGALSALIVTTCVAPVLVGALLVIGQSGSAVRGGVALFSMGLGMGAPLLAVGASAGSLLPRPGAWMDLIKQLFGAMMLSVSAWLLSRIVPERFALFLWAVPLTAAAVVLWLGAMRVRHNKLFVRLAGAAFTAWAAVMAVGGALGNTNALLPLSRPEANQLSFRTIKSVGDLQREVADAKAHGKPVLLDFYADWCVSCKEMERFTFSDSTVQTALNGAVLLRADVTSNDDDDQALLKHFGIFGPPTIAFYGTDGEERHNYRVVGFMKAPDFATLAKQALGPGGATPATAPQAAPSTPQTTAGAPPSTTGAAGAT